MTLQPKQRPKAQDAVLGSQTLLPSRGVVLGGFEGVRRRFASSAIASTIAALRETLNYDETRFRTGLARFTR